MTVEHAKFKNCPRIVLTVKKDNKPARKFYKKHGYKTGRTIKWETKGGNNMCLIECFSDLKK